MSESSQVQTGLSGLLRVAAGEDRFAEHHGLGINVIDFKLAPQDSNGIFIIEITSHAKGGPERHLHYEQDEWFYAVQGEYLFEVGQERFTLRSGDSVLAPRLVPHVWTHVGSSSGRLVIAFNPAGKMESFFREAAKANQVPGRDSKLWRTHGMEWVGPPLAIT